MSGPIVRKYGFPNFEKIFGERGLQHGAEEPEKSSEMIEGAQAPQTPDASADAEKDVPPKKVKKG